MAEMTTYVGIEPRSVNITGTAVSKGYRLTRGSNGLLAVAAASLRGEYVSLVDIAASESGQAASLSGGGKVPALAVEACAVGDSAYSAAGGKFSKTAGGNVVLGRWTQAANVANVLGEVELLDVL